MTRGKKKKKTTPFLPQDMLIEILIRLPVKSLVRFRCVSKSWLSLISDPYFATFHFELAATCPQKLVVSNGYAIQSIDFNAPLHDDSISTIVKLNSVLPRPEYAQIIGSCRGFLLFDYQAYLFLWNPTTGVHKRIPWPLVYSDLDDPSSPYLYGFGYDSSTDDYLVPLVSYDPNTRYTVTRVEFFSLKANTWKELDPRLPYTTSCEYFDPKAGLLFNGNIHWIATRRSHYDYDRWVKVILAFDLMERRFFEIALPHDVGYDLELYDLRILGGFLGLCAMCQDDTVGGIWVMKEYKVQSSWAKRHIVMSRDDFPTRFLSPICFTTRGDIVGVDGQGLVIFNDNGEVQDYRSYYARTCRFDVAMFTESLLSLPVPGDSYQAEHLEKSLQSLSVPGDSYQADHLDNLVLNILLTFAIFLMLVLLLLYYELF